jgi:hypothetical protein
MSCSALGTCLQRPHPVPCAVAADMEILQLLDSLAPGSYAEPAAAANTNSTCAWGGKQQQPALVQQVGLCCWIATATVAAPLQEHCCLQEHSSCNTASARLVLPACPLLSASAMCCPESLPCAAQQAPLARSLLNHLSAVLQASDHLHSCMHCKRCPASTTHACALQSSVSAICYRHLLAP